MQKCEKAKAGQPAFLLFEIINDCVSIYTMSEVKENTIGKRFTMGELIRFVSAPVITRLVMSLLSTLDDGLFISRYCGQSALASFTLSLPLFMLFDAFTMLLGAVSTKSSILMGEKKHDEANSAFTTMLLVSLVVGTVLFIIVTFFGKPILMFLGARDHLLDLAMQYIQVSRFNTGMMFCGFIFSRFYVIAGKPKLSMVSSMMQTICNLFFDWLFIVRLQTGIVGTAYANIIGTAAVVIMGLFFFSNPNAEIHFGKPMRRPGRLILDVMALGRASAITSIAVSINSFIVNQVLLELGGETIVAAYTIVNNVTWMFMSAFFGFVGATSPIVSYAYGERNADKLGNIIRKAVVLVEIISVMIGIFLIILRPFIIQLYLGSDAGQASHQMVSYGMKVVPYVFAVFSFNCIVQEYCIAVANNRASTILSILENVIFPNALILILPKFFGVNIIWYVFLIGELMTLIFSAYTAYVNRDNYGYGKRGIMIVN